MNIEHKKTALEDDAALYQKRDDSLGKKDTSSLSRRQKAGYFKDYYLKTILAAAAIVIAIGSIIYTSLFNRSENFFSAAFINEAYLIDTESLADTLRSYYGVTSDNQLITIENYDTSNYASQIKYSTMLSTQAIDVVICPRDFFKEQARLGTFTDLSGLLPDDLYAKLKGQFVAASEVETDNEGNVTKTYPAAFYGINISGNALYREFGGTGNDVILAVARNTQQTDSVLRFLTWLTNDSASASAESVPEESPQT
ncbi:MAG: hypothetical protein Q4C50_03710 [Eubacteriales bacterium]|nr:hypothetical protein [Eubacteriales bacterium]